MGKGKLRGPMASPPAILAPTSSTSDQGMAARALEPLRSVRELPSASYLRSPRSWTTKRSSEAAAGPPCVSGLPHWTQKASPS